MKKILSDSFKEEEEEEFINEVIKEIFDYDTSEQLKDFMNSLDDQGIHNQEEVLNKPTYKECLMKGVDPLDGEYIDWKLDEKFEEISPQWKKILKKKY
jgi:hypothetical protein